MWAWWYQTTFSDDFGFCVLTRISIRSHFDWYAFDLAVHFDHVSVFAVERRLRRRRDARRQRASRSHRGRRVCASILRRNRSNHRSRVSSLRPSEKRCSIEFQYKNVIVSRICCYLRHVFLFDFFKQYIN